ncbi:hypothetical protein RN001_000840 [Aquatica leii]|uniref:Structure-specific endonuclease subunit SLX4 n=1 Tax=Aquatica leii TaxID=1421715 RepID=A0AAN7Q3D8_9COLE|nr:hypothetical protein RN001_000840 [Aquatica leii]
MSTISKYFKILNENVRTDSKNNSESPYKNVLNNIKVIDLNSSNESNDFKTPKPVLKTKPKVLPRNTNTKKPSAKRRLSNTKKTSNPIKAITAKTDCNLEHLHMAVALSNSLHDEHKDKISNSSNKNEDNVHSITLLDKLQQYKFQSGSSKGQLLNRRTYLERKKVKSKLQYVRPVLLLRTQEDREKLILNKISLILSDSKGSRCTRVVTQENPSSEYLQKCYSNEAKIFTKSKCMNKSLSDFYINSLKIDRNSVNCGTLLKNWHIIPGRSISPVFATTMEKQDNLEVLDDSECLSPDLFDSEDELPQQFSKISSDSPVLKCSFSNTEETNSLCLNVNPPLEATVNSFRQRLEASSPDEVIENDNGICVFETFSNQNVCVELSSDDSNSKTTNLEVEQEASLRSGVSETFEKIVSLVSNDDTMDYVYKLLEDESKNSCKEPIKFGNEHEGLYSQEINLACLSSRNHNIFEQSPKTSDDQNQSLDSLEASKINCSTNDSIQPEINFSFRTLESFNSTKSEESIYISDEEINYSCLHSTPTRVQRKGKFSKKGSFYSFSENSSSVSSGDDEFNQEQSSSICDLSISPSSKQCISNNKSQNVELVDLVNSKIHDLESTLLYNVLSDKPEKSNCEIINKSPSTPKTEVILKLSNVTPMPNYNVMNTPKFVKELEKFGLKPMKRQRGVQLLNYIYETTHPVVNIANEHDENDRNNKKRKVLNNATPTSSSKEENSDKKRASSIRVEKTIFRDDEELIFERKQSKKISSCMVPLQIAWYNLVKSDLNIQKNILLYEPLQLEDLYQTLKSYGYKYHIQDLLTFLDRKCITIRTEQIPRRRRKKHKESKTQI